MRVAAWTLLALVGGLCKAAVPWPVTASGFVLGNNYGALQTYTGYAPYLHDGLDILVPATSPVFAVADGKVNHRTMDPQGLYTGLMIGEPRAGGKGYVYWHLIADTVKVAMGEDVAAGQHLGDVVQWPVAGFHHVHFSEVTGTGGYPWAWYRESGDPLRTLDPIDDTSAPSIHQVTVVRDGKPSEILDLQSVSGLVDVVVHSDDLYGSGTWGLAPKQIRARLVDSSGQTILESRTVAFEGPLGVAKTTPWLVYSQGQAIGNYAQRTFHVIATHDDGVPGFTHDDGKGAWDTTTIPDGDYSLLVEVKDAAGNAVRESVSLRIRNETPAPPA